MSADIPVAIVGAGLAGLTTAYELTAAGVPVVVLEASERLGGRVQTVEFGDGMTAEAHMEEYWQGSPAYALLHRLGLPLDIDHAHSSVVLGGRLHPYQGAGDRDEYLAGIFDRRERSAFLAWNAEVAGFLGRLPEATGGAHHPPWVTALMATPFSAQVALSVSEPRVAEWIRVVVESETAIEWNRISALDGLVEMRPFLDGPTRFGELNAHVRGGNARFVDALVHRLPDGCVRAGRRVRRIRDRGNVVEVEYTDVAGRPGRLRCDQAVVTVPQWSLGSIELDIALHPAARTAVETSAAGSYVKVLLRLRPEARDLWSRYGEGFFTLLTDAAAGCVYLTEDPAGVGGRGTERDLVMTLLMHGPHARVLSGRLADEIAHVAVARLEDLSFRSGRNKNPARLLPGISGLVTEIRVYDYPSAVAYWPVDRGRSRFDHAAEMLRRPQGRVHFGGDTTESSHSDGAVRSAQRIVRTLRRLLEGTEGSPSIAAQQPSAKVRS